MAYHDKTESLPARIKRIYSDLELANFDTKIKQFKTPSGAFDWDKYYKSEKIISDHGVVCYSIEKGKDGEITSANIPMNEQINLENQWEKWTARKNYGKKFSLNQLDTTALQSGFKAPHIEKVDPAQIDRDLAKAQTVLDEFPGTENF